MSETIRDIFRSYTRTLLVGNAGEVIYVEPKIDQAILSIKKIVEGIVPTKEDMKNIVWEIKLGASWQDRFEEAIIKHIKSDILELFEVG